MLCIITDLLWYPWHSDISQLCLFARCDVAFCIIIHLPWYPQWGYFVFNTSFWYELFIKIEFQWKFTHVKREECILCTTQVRKHCQVMTNECVMSVCMDWYKWVYSAMEILIWCLTWVKVLCRFHNEQFEMFCQKAIKQKHITMIFVCFWHKTD